MDTVRAFFVGSYAVDKAIERNSRCVLAARRSEALTLHRLRDDLWIDDLAFDDLVDYLRKHVQGIKVCRVYGYGAASRSPSSPAGRVRF